MRMCVFQRGRDFQKVNLLGVISLTSEYFVHIVSEGQRFSEGEHARSYFPYFSHSAFHIQSVFLSVCVDVFT